MINKSLFTSNSDEWYTPDKIYQELNNEFNFTLDPCCTHESAKTDRHFTIQENGLNQSWNGETVFVNPPYSNIKQWVEKCHKEWNNNTTIVMLIPARTDTKYFHEHIYNIAEIRFVKGRIHFNDSKNSAPFPSMFVIYKKENKQ